MDNQQQAFPNGSAAAAAAAAAAAGLSLIPGLTLLPGQFSTPGLPEIPHNENPKMEAPSWGMSDPTQEKQHPVSLSTSFVIAKC